MFSMGNSILFLSCEGLVELFAWLVVIGDFVHWGFRLLVISFVVDFVRC